MKVFKGILLFLLFVLFLASFSYLAVDADRVTEDVIVSVSADDSPGGGYLLSAKAQNATGEALYDVSLSLELPRDLDVLPGNNSLVRQLSEIPSHDSAELKVRVDETPAHIPYEMRTSAVTQSGEIQASGSGDMFSSFGLGAEIGWDWIREWVPAHLKLISVCVMVFSACMLILSFVKMRSWRPAIAVILALSIVLSIFSPLVVNAFFKTEKPVEEEQRVIRTPVDITLGEEPYSLTAVLSYSTVPDSDREDVLLDSDGDGVFDEDEIALGTDPNRADDTQTDSDRDGLSDYAEINLHETDPKKTDTDEDGLSDYEEVSLTGSDPKKYDSIAEAVSDADADCDGDAISNALELHEYFTNPVKADTDGDGLNDGEEINTYSTNPTDPDTDSDGAPDGWEIENGFDPVVSQESFTVAETVLNEDGTESTCTVALKIRGNPEDVKARKEDRYGLIGPDLPGLLADAVRITAAGAAVPYDPYAAEDAVKPSANGDEPKIEAVLTFTFDPANVSADGNAVVYQYDEETQILRPLATTVDGTVATAVGSSAGTYALMDSSKAEAVFDPSIMHLQSASYVSAVFEVVFVIDNSPSMNANDPDYTRLDIVDEFIGKLRQDHDKAGVVRFAATAETLYPLSVDLQGARSVVDDIENVENTGCNPESGTNGSDGLYHALEQLENSDGDHRMIIFLTDGEDTDVSYSYDSLIRRAVAHDITIYSIGMGDVDEEILRQVADETGGEFFYASAMDTDAVMDLSDAFKEIALITMDVGSDSNHDGISDYHTRLMCDGILRTGTGMPVFGNVTYEQVQANADFDGDGVLNGEEMVACYDSELDVTYIYLKSYADDPDSDDDGIPDGEDSAPLERGRAGGIVGQMTLLACGGAPAALIVLDSLTGGKLKISTGHSFIVFESYVYNLVDSRDFNLIYTIDEGESFFFPAPENISEDAVINPVPERNTLIKPKNVLTMSAGSPSGHAEDAFCSVANLEIIKACYWDCDYRPNGYITWQVTQDQVKKLFSGFEREKENQYDGVTYNCTDVSINIWNDIFGTNIQTDGFILPLFGICTPRGLMYALRERSDGNSDFDLGQLMLDNGNAETIVHDPSGSGSNTGAITGGSIGSIIGGNAGGSTGASTGGSAGITIGGSVDGSIDGSSGSTSAGSSSGKKSSGD